MDSSIPYNGGLTAEQFLFNEIRIVARLYLENKTLDEILKEVKEDNLFQYPTENQISRITKACYKRIVALNNENLVYEIVNSPMYIGKQINVYAMMRYNRLVWEFMILTIGEKFESLDYSFSKKDINIFFMRLMEQDKNISTWSDSTINKIKQVLLKMLVESEFIDNTKSSELNNVYICDELENGIKENGDYIVLKAFNKLR